MEINPLELTQKLKERFELFINTLHQTKYERINQLLKEEREKLMLFHLI